MKICPGGVSSAFFMFCHIFKRRQKRPQGKFSKFSFGAVLVRVRTSLSQIFSFQRCLWAEKLETRKRPITTDSLKRFNYLKILKRFKQRRQPRRRWRIRKPSDLLQEMLAADFWPFECGIESQRFRVLYDELFEGTLNFKKIFF